MDESVKKKTSQELQMLSSLMSQRSQSLESLFKGISEIFWKSEEKNYKNVKLFSEDLIFFKNLKFLNKI